MPHHSLIPSIHGQGFRKKETWSGSLLILMLAGLVLCLLAPGTVRADNPVLKVQAPKSAPLGKPFMISVSSQVHFQDLKLTWQDRTIELPLADNGNSFSASLLLGSDVKLNQPGPRQLRIEGQKYGQTVSAVTTITLDKAAYPVQRLTLPKSQVDLSQKALSRHRKEKRQVQECLQSFTAERSWNCPFARPAGGQVSSAYGLKRIINGSPRSPHRGLDLRTGANAPVQAVNSGRVILTGNHFFAGNAVYIDHGQGVVSMYFHLSSIKVTEGQDVSRGQTIGLTGSSGRATGPHLHFGMSILGHLVDPEPVVSNEICPQNHD